MSLKKMLHLEQKRSKAIWNGVHEKIQKWVKKEYGFVPKTCCIAEVKEISGMPVRKAHNRRGAERVK